MPVHLLTSPALPSAWSRLDEFEGHEYVRVCVPLYDEQNVLVDVANFYEAAGPVASSSQVNGVRASDLETSQV